MGDSYYNFWDQGLTQNEAEHQCNVYGKHLASIHSASKMDLMTETCQCDRCWIGLETQLNVNSTMIYEWIDDSNINTSFINKNWCDRYPDDMNTTYFVYIDETLQCWRYTNNSSLRMCSICGPTMFDVTNGFYFVSNMIIPLILSFIGLIYSLYICKSLKNGLCKDMITKNWVIIPTKMMKRTAILAPSMMAIFFFFVIIHSILLYSAYHKTKIFAPSSLIDDEYPTYYKTAGIIAIFIGIIYFIFVSIIYIHLLIRLKHAFNNNAVFRSGIPSKCKYNLIILLIIFYFLLPIIYLIINGKMHAIKMIVILLWIVVDITINILLLYLYFKGLYKFNKYSIHYDVLMNTDRNSMRINYEIQAQHEIMIEFRRYTVLFGIISFINILITILTVTSIFIIMIYSENGEYEEICKYIKNIIFMILLYLKQIISLQCILYSFNFHHIKYKKDLNFCDKWMKNKCDKMVERKNNKEIRLSKPTNTTWNETETVETDININNNIQITAHSLHSIQNINAPQPITIDDFLSYNEVQTESHPNIATMQNAEDNVDAINFIVDYE